MILQLEHLAAARVHCTGGPWPGGESSSSRKQDRWWAGLTTLLVIGARVYLLYYIKGMVKYCVYVFLFYGMDCSCKVLPYYSRIGVYGR